jgi:hypothetical protein
MFVSVKNVNNKIFVKSQYNQYFNVVAKRIGGKFDYTEKTWVFDSRNGELLKEKLLSIFGTDGYSQSCVDVEVTVKRNIIAYKQPLYLAGRIIAYAKGRDSGAWIGDGITFVNKFATSGGSMNNWTTEIKEGAIFKILDLYTGAVKFLDECDAIEYKIIQNKIDSKSTEKEKLEHELKIIQGRIAKLEDLENKVK